MQASAADKASKAQSAATDKQLALQKQIFDTNTANSAPWVDAGKEALSTLTQKVNDGSFDLSKYGYNDLIQDPGYQFRLQQGVDALDSSAAARGKLQSGDQRIATINYGQQAGSQEFGNAFARTQAERDAAYGRLDRMSSEGQAAAAQQAAAGTNYANTASNTIQTGVANQNADTMNAANAWANAGGGLASSVNQSLENYTLYNRLQAPVQPATPYASYGSIY